MCEKFDKNKLNSLLFNMQKIWEKLKKYWVVLCGGVLPYILFFLPVYMYVFEDGAEKITYLYNFYETMSITNNTFFTILMILFIIFSVVNLILFVLLMIDSYKILMYLQAVKIIVYVVNILLCVLSATMLIDVLVMVVSSGATMFKIHLHCGTIILLAYMLLNIGLIYRKTKGKI